VIESKDRPGRRAAEAIRRRTHIESSSREPVASVERRRDMSGVLAGTVDRTVHRSCSTGAPGPDPDAKARSEPGRLPSPFPVPVAAADGPALTRTALLALLAMTLVRPWRGSRPEVGKRAGPHEPDPPHARSRRAPTRFRALIRRLPSQPTYEEGVHRTFMRRTSAD